MKQSYTTFQLSVLKYAKVMGLTMEQLTRIHMHAVKKGIATFDAFEVANTTTVHGKSAAKLTISTELMIYHGHALHLFLPGKEFCDWLVGCVKKAEAHYLHAVWEVVGSHQVAVLHFPCEVKQPSVAIVYQRGKDEGSIIMFQTPVLSSGGLNWAVTFKNDNVTMDPDELSTHDAHSKLWDPRIHYLTKLVFGLGMYMNCFPETVKQGPPEDLKHPSYHKHAPDMTKTVGVTPKVKTKAATGGTHASPVAHFRVGHFRVLRSPYFANKQFQSVFVSEAFVNPKHAKTVLSPEQTEAAKQLEQS